MNDTLDPYFYARHDGRWVVCGPGDSPQWRPIETVPTDGRTVLLYYGDHSLDYPHISSGFKTDHAGWWQPYMASATHWAPLPELPDPAGPTIYEVVLDVPALDKNVAYIIAKLLSANAALEDEATRRRLFKDADDLLHALVAIMPTGTIVELHDWKILE